jgi:para-nitrobenzyl esterase
VVLAAINYRLGTEGFLEIPGAPANRAVRDWVRALEWVAENIAAFGGDPARVSIAGQSAGGGACAALLGVPAARGLFRGAACLSGGTALQQTADGVRAVAGLMAGHLGVTSLDHAALEAMPAEQILAAQGAVAATVMGGSRDGAAVAALLSDGLTLPWAPWPDGEVVTAGPLEAAAGHSDVALLAGATAHEFNMAWMAADWVTTAMVAEALAQAGVPARAAAAYLDQAGPHPGATVGQALTDRTFRVPAQVLAQSRAAAGGPAWVYDFGWAAPSGPLAGLAFHCLDVPFFFDALGEPGVTEAAGPNPPAELATAMHGALVRFVTGGDPGWDRYEAGRRPVMVFGEPSAVASDPLRAERVAWT